MQEILRSSSLGHVLLVDDDAVTRERVSHYLALNDFRVTPAENGKRMMEVLDDEPIDLVALELRLRGEDGLQLARQLRKASRIPIIIVTSRHRNAPALLHGT
jgi:two-component system OmpR family response regulator